MYGQRDVGELESDDADMAFDELGGNLIPQSKHWIHHFSNNDHKPPRSTTPLIVSAIDVA